jgi:hypothetical protein
MQSCADALSCVMVHLLSCSVCASSTSEGLPNLNHYWCLQMSSSQAVSDDGTGSSYSAAAMPALQDEEDYWQRVQEYEPWALEEDAGASQPPSIMSHMKQVLE